MVQVARQPNAFLTGMAHHLPRLFNIVRYRLLHQHVFPVRYSQHRGLEMVAAFLNAGRSYTYDIDRFVLQQLPQIRVRLYPMLRCRRICPILKQIAYGNQLRIRILRVESAVNFPDIVYAHNGYPDHDGPSFRYLAAFASSFLAWSLRAFEIDPIYSVS
jgi:hypothetical protein